MTRIKSIIFGSVVGAVTAACGTIYFGPGFPHSPPTTETFRDSNSSGTTTETEIEVPALSIAIVGLGAVTGALAAAGLSVIRHQRRT